uniref:translation elongation factor Ts n=1 Tax=uncultured Salinisphaera sp. TaxID=359372 RepID=UPI0032B1C304
TGAGMMECKKALTATDGDIDAAADNMRREGLAKADKKAGRVAAEGRIATATSTAKDAAVLVEVNCETDFVGKNEEFVEFADALAALILEKQPMSAEEVNDLHLAGQTVDDRRRELTAKLGEKIDVRRFARVEAVGGNLDVYSHGARIASVVAVEGGNESLARDLAMHVAATNPAFLSTEDVPEERRNSEKEMLMAQARDSGKPDDIIEKMVEGRLNKFLGEITLVGQPFVKDPDTTVGKLAADQNAKITAFARLEVGEGIEKKEEDFAEEVKKQAGTSA